MEKDKKSMQRKFSVPLIFYDRESLSSYSTSVIVVQIRDCEKDLQRKKLLAVRIKVYNRFFYSQNKI